MREPTLIDLLRRRADELGDAVACTFLADGEREAAAWSYRDLDRKARAIAVHLRRRLAPGDRALMAYPPGLEFIAAFFGCLYAGVIAVPVPPPHPRRGSERIEAISRDCEPGLLLSANDGFSEEAADAWTPPPVDGEHLALLQYTSGSTAAPKGVRVSHRNILSNLAMIRTEQGTGAGSRSVSWLPAYHDMGLIEGILAPLHGGYPVWLMAPAAFLQRPSRWLEAITRYGATVSGGPNFAYELCVRRILEAELGALDLRSWRVAYNGSEPVRADTLDAFAKRFSSCGFSAGAQRTVYGLAEATLLVSASPRGRDRPRVVALEGGLEAVSCGAPAEGLSLSIVEPGGEHCLPVGQVGEICVAGPSITSGYWRSGETSPTLRTGDLGFLRDGELFVTGRIKDLVILRGRKHYPQDIERTVEASHPLVARGGVAAFAVQELHGEHLVVVAELEADAPSTARAVLDAIAQAVFRRHECAVNATLLVRKGALPRTSSGKLMRFRCRENYLAGALPALAA